MRLYWHRTFRIGRWEFDYGPHLGSWAIGFWFDRVPLMVGLDLLPLSLSAERDEDTRGRKVPSWGGTLVRLIVGKLEMRLELDWNIWRVGVVMADPDDWGFYLGCLNIQAEYGKFWWDNSDWRKAWTRTIRIRPAPAPPYSTCTCGDDSKPPSIPTP